MSYTDLESIYNARSNSEKDAEKYKHKFVKYPLYLLTNLFKAIFSFTIGLKWFLNQSNRLNTVLPCKKIILPTITYGANKASSEGISFALEFSYIKAPVVLTPLNFLLVLLNYIARNVGKLLGLILVSVFTVPAYLFIESYYGIKHATMDNQYNRHLREISSKDLAEGWVNSTSHLSDKHFSEVAKRVDISTFMQAALTKRKKITEEKTFPKQRVASNLSDLSGLGHGFYPQEEHPLAPLTSKIASYIEKRREFLRPYDSPPATAERPILDETELMVRSAYPLLKNPESFGFINGSTFYGKGVNYQAQGSLDMAFAYLSNVPESNDSFNAMTRCGSILMVQGKYVEAGPYLALSQDVNLIETNARLLDRRNVASVTAMTTSSVPLTPAELAAKQGFLPPPGNGAAETPLLPGQSTQYDSQTHGL